MNNKKFLGQEEHLISQNEISAWNRGNRDLLKAQILKRAQQPGVEKSIAILKTYSEFGDIQRTALKHNSDITIIKAILTKFGISSIEQSRRLLSSGIIAEYEQAIKDQNIIKQKTANDDLAMQNVRMLELNKPQPKETVSHAELLQQAQIKNKQDQLRAILKQGINPSTGKTSGFYIPISAVSEFKSLIPSGISAIQRRFGGTKKDILSEIKRLAPHIDIDLLRP